MNAVEQGLHPHLVDKETANQNNPPPADRPPAAVKTLGAPRESTSLRPLMMSRELSTSSDPDETPGQQQSLQKLYGRQKDQDRMLEAYRRIQSKESSATNTTSSSTDNTPTETMPLHKQPKKSELISILGETGMGKTTLSQSLKRHIVNDGGCMVWGRCGQMPRPEPHHAFCEIITDFVTQVLQRPDGLKTIQHALRRGGINRKRHWQILCRVFPALALIQSKSDLDEEDKHDNAFDVREESELDTYFPSDSNVQFKYLFRSFLGCIAAQQPLVILLDDLHWAGEASLDLLRFLLEESQIEGLLFVVTLRNDMKDNVKRLVKFSDELLESNIAITDITLGALSVKDVEDLLVGEFQMDQDDAEELAPIIHEHSAGGNPFHIWRVISLCAEEKLFQFDIGHFEWKSSEEVNKVVKQAGDPVRQQLLTRVAELSNDTREYLRIASCLGCRVHKEILQYFMAKPVDDVLAELLACGIFKHNATRDSWSFAHDIVQETIYKEMILPKDRIGYHYRIGRKLWRSLDEEKLGDFLLLVLSQLLIAITDDKTGEEEERVAIARLCLNAGVRGVSESTFRSAAFYLQKGIELLGSAAWRTEYRLCLELHNAAAEVYTSLGAYEQSYDKVNEVLRHSRTFRDTLRARTVKIHALGTSAEYEQATAEGLSLLEQLGVVFPEKPSKVRLMFEWWRLSRSLRHRSTESILRLPIMSDPENLSAMQVLNIVFVVLAFTRDELSPWIAMEMCKRTLVHGLSPVASVGFALYAYSMGGLGKNPEEALRFGQLALALYRKCGARAYLARVCALYFDGIHPWKNHPSAMFASLENAYHVGMETGDTEFAMLCAGLPAWNKFDFAPLQEVDRELTALQARIKIHRQSTFEAITLPIHQCAQTLMGLTEDPTVLRGELYNSAIENPLPNDHPVRFWAKVNEVVLCCLFGRYKEAVEYSKIAVEVVNRDFGPISVSIAMFFCGVAETAYARERQKKHAPLAKRYCKRLFQWSQRAPDNFSGKHLLLDAELTSLSNHKSTFLKYKNALAVLIQGNYFPLVAWGSERLAFYMRESMGDHDGARLYFQQAISHYSQWGAVTKVKQLSKLMEAFDSGLNGSTSTIDITPTASGSKDDMIE